MDIWFTLFVFVVAIAAAVGLSLFLVGYISLMPVTFAQGRNWLWAVGILPLAIVGVPFFGAALGKAFGQVADPAAVAKWAAIPALALHFTAVGTFAFLRRAEYGKATRQLAFGVLLAALAGGLLYGVGPLFADRIVASVK